MERADRLSERIDYLGDRLDKRIDRLTYWMAGLMVTNLATIVGLLLRQL